MIHLKHIFFIISICLSFLACNNCSKFENEQYNESDTLTLNSEHFFYVKNCFDAVKETDITQKDMASFRMWYRFSFGKYEYIIHLSKTEKGCTLKSMAVDNIFNDSKWTTLVVDSTIKELSIEKWNTFENLIYNAQFWTLTQLIDDRGLDGHTFVLEGYRPEAEPCGKRSYHIIGRWSPRSEPLRTLCDSLLAYADLRAPLTHLDFNAYLDRAADSLRLAV
jgi:hypothetical protein